MLYVFHDQGSAPSLSSIADHRGSYFSLRLQRRKVLLYIDFSSVMAKIASSSLSCEAKERAGLQNKSTTRSGLVMLGGPRACGSSPRSALLQDKGKAFIRWFGTRATILCGPCIVSSCDGDRSHLRKKQLLYYSIFTREWKSGEPSTFCYGFWRFPSFSLNLKKKKSLPSKES